MFQGLSLIRFFYRLCNGGSPDKHHFSLAGVEISRYAISPARKCGSPRSNFNFGRCRSGLFHVRKCGKSAGGVGKVGKSRTCPNFGRFLTRWFPGVARRPNLGKFGQIQEKADFFTSPVRDGALPGTGGVIEFDARNATRRLYWPLL